MLQDGALIVSDARYSPKGSITLRHVVDVFRKDSELIENVPLKSLKLQNASPMVVKTLLKSLENREFDGLIPALHDAFTGPLLSGRPALGEERSSVVLDLDWEDLKIANYVANS